MHRELLRNLPGNPDWEGSFYERLTEYGVWEIPEFWRLHLDLINIATANACKSLIDRELALYVVTLHLKIQNLIVAHYNVNDIFKIKNLNQEHLYQFQERLEHAVASVFSGEVLPESAYELVNPLLENA